MSGQNQAEPEIPKEGKPGLSQFPRTHKTQSESSHNPGAITPRRQPKCVGPGNSSDLGLKAADCRRGHEGSERGGDGRVFRGSSLAVLSLSGRARARCN